MWFSPTQVSSRYDVLIAPMMHMVKPGFAEKVEALVERGGTFVTTYFSGVVDETDLAFEGYPGPLSRVTGLRVDEIDALYPDQSNTILMSDRSGAYRCDHLVDLVQVDSACVLATFGSDFYKGMPALTENDFGKGKAYYIASDPNDEFLEKFYGGILDRHEIAPLLKKMPTGVEVTTRVKDDQQIVFVLNHNAQAVNISLGDLSFDDLLDGEMIDGQLTLEAHDAAILRLR